MFDTRSTGFDRQPGGKNVLRGVDVAVVQGPETEVREQMLAETIAAGVSARRAQQRAAG